MRQASRQNPILNFFANVFITLSVTSGYINSILSPTHHFIAGTYIAALHALHTHSSQLPQLFLLLHKYTQSVATPGLEVNTRLHQTEHQGLEMPIGYRLFSIPKKYRYRFGFGISTNKRSVSSRYSFMQL